MRWLLFIGVALVMLPATASGAAPRTDGSTPAPAKIVRLVTHVPASTLNQVGAGSVYGLNNFGVFNLKQSLTKDEKPEVLSMNLAWCPHCAANSWALAMALSRFGTLTGLREINSGTYYCHLTADPCTLQPSPCYPYTHGLSFFGAGYHSSYLSFREIVLQDVDGHNLQKPTRSQFQAINSFDQQGQTPALDVGGAYGFLNSGYDPGALAHKTWSQIAGNLANPHNSIARHIDGLANLFTAAMCSVTGGRPSSVCTSKGVLATGGKLRAAPGPPPPPPGPPS